MSDNDEEFRDSFETVRSRGKTSAESKSGWAVLSAFSSTAHSTRPAITPASVTAKKDFSPLTKLLIVLVPIVLLFGYYSYSQVSGATFFGYFSPKPSINLTDGLVAHWTFDGLDVTDKIYDKSGNGHDAYFSNGATSSAKIAGKIGQAFNFDGIDDRVQFTPIATGETFTITGWIKPSGQIASWGHIIGQDSNNCFQYVKSTKKLLMNYGEVTVITQRLSKITNGVLSV